jgi:Subtilase family
MPDHGLFIAGIVRDLAPGATIECMRVLSDYCVGDLATLTKALELIHNRMSRQNPDANFTQGDLYQKPVVINMSLVIPPDDKEAKHLGFKPKRTKLLRKHLLDPMNRLSELGAVFTASAGNEGDLRVGSKAMNPKRIRPFALYPSAFAYNVSPDPVPRVIPVGAVRGDKKPASYSCYPGIKGIATYGGEVPDANPPKPPKKPPTPTPDCRTYAEDIDAVVGIYSSSTFPSLSIDDCDRTYPAPNPPNGWAYWVGTSFATPIISAVLARIIELKGGVLASNEDMLVAITNAVPASPVTWTKLDPSIDPVGSETGRLIQVTQCKPAVQNNNVQKGQKGKKRNKVEV